MYQVTNFIEFDTKLYINFVKMYKSGLVICIILLVIFENGIFSKESSGPRDKTNYIPYIYLRKIPSEKTTENTKDVEIFDIYYGPPKGSLHSLPSDAINSPSYSNLLKHLDQMSTTSILRFGRSIDFRKENLFWEKGSKLVLHYTWRDVLSH